MGKKATIQAQTTNAAKVLFFSQTWNDLGLTAQVLDPLHGERTGVHPARSGWR